MRLAIEPECRGGNDVDLDVLDIETTMPSHSFDAISHDWQCVLGQIDQHRPRLRDGVLAQAGGAGGHAQGQVEAQPGLRAFGGAADHPDRRATPELFDKPVLGVVLAGDLSDAHDGKWLFTFNGHLQTFAFFFEAARGRFG